jgi:hypothetical protein
VKLPRFSSEQTLLILIIGLVVIGFAVWRCYALYQ